MMSEMEPAVRGLLNWDGHREFSYSGSITLGTEIHYKSGHSIVVSPSQYDSLLDRFRGCTVEIGISRTSPPHGSIGEWLKSNVSKTAMASYVGTILIAEGLAEKVGKTGIKVF